MCATALRILAMDAIESANSGHPGVALGLADVLCVLWRKYIRISPEHLQAANRDHFVLSVGHASALYYALLHLAGFPVSIEDLKSFRQLHSITPGHPERDLSLGIDVATGPLGQGLANAVGMAAVKLYQAKQQERAPEGHVFAMVGDGCLMEGISHEACALASSLGLGNLVVAWDDNGISIDGPLQPWFAEDVVKRFQAYGWRVIAAVDGHDVDAIDSAFAQATSSSSVPTLVVFKTRIGYGSDWEGQAIAHGKPLGSARLAKLREHLQWPHASFEVPDAVYAQWGKLRPQVSYRMSDATDCSVDWSDYYQMLMQDVVPEATRVSSKRCLALLLKKCPEVIGGSADLSESTGVMQESNTVWQPTKPGNFIHFGVREFAMFAMANGMAALGMRPYVSTFLVFSDYGINAIRMAALMRLPVTFVLTHDSVAVGEDGPTHQPIEHLAHLRAMPNLQVWRPCDRRETMVAWQSIMADSSGPSCLVLSRQTLPQLATQPITDMAKGGYKIAGDINARIALLATGSEVGCAVEAYEILAKQGIQTYVVSVPCMERFLAQPAALRQGVLPSSLLFCVAIEAGCGQSWFHFGIPKENVLSLEDFGLSGKGSKVLTYFGMHAQAIVDRVQVLLNQYEDSQVE